MVREAIHVPSPTGETKQWQRGKWAKGGGRHLPGTLHVGLLVEAVPHGAAPTPSGGRAGGGVRRALLGTAIVLVQATPRLSTAQGRGGVSSLA